MIREEKCKLAIEKGYTYDPESGKIFGIRGTEIVTNDKKGYIIISLTLNKRKFYLKGHHLAWYWVTKEIVKQIDHINRITNDNRICNLRAVTQQLNNYNMKDGKGYYWNKRISKWSASIKVGKKPVFLGNYINEQDANQAYLDAKEKYHNIDNPELNQKPESKNSKGYCWDQSRKKWKSYLIIESKHKHLGYFNTEEEAKTAFENGRS